MTGSAASLPARYARCALFELDLQDIHSGLAEIVKVCLYCGIALLLVAVVMDEESGGGIGRVERSGHEGVHYAFLRVGKLGRTCRRQCEDSGDGREAEDSAGIFHIETVLVGWIRVDFSKDSEF